MSTCFVSAADPFSAAPPISASSRWSAIALGIAAMLCSTSALATACPMGVLCDDITIDLSSTLLPDGKWQYDYTVKDLYYPYDPSQEVPPPPQSSSYRFIKMRLPYFEDAGIQNVVVGSQFGGQLKVEIQDVAFSGAKKSILVSAVGPWLETTAPQQLVSNVNSLLSFTSPYAPLSGVDASLVLDNASAYVPNWNGTWGGEVLFVAKLPPEWWNVYPNAVVSSLDGPVSIPHSPMSTLVPESSGAAMAAVGGMLMAAMMRRRRTADQRPN